MPLGKIDWKESWKTRSLSYSDWEELKKEMKDVHQELLSEMRQRDHWDGDDDVGASFALLAHSAYHLGGIRQLLRILRT